MVCFVWGISWVLCGFPVDTLLNNDAVITSKRHFDVTMTLLLRHVLGGFIRFIHTCPCFTDTGSNKIAPLPLTHWFEWNFISVILKIILVIDSWSISLEIVLGWISLDLTDDKSTLVQVMACVGRQEGITWANVDPILCRYMVSPVHNDLCNPEGYDYMMTPLNGNVFRVTGHLCGEFAGHATKASDAKLDIFFVLRLNKRLSKQQEAGDLRRHRVHYDVTVMSWAAPNHNITE